jgi:hypothetical protein
LAEYVGLENFRLFEEPPSADGSRCSPFYRLLLYHVFVPAKLDFVIINSLGLVMLVCGFKALRRQILLGINADTMSSLYRSV